MITIKKASEKAKIINLQAKQGEIKLVSITKATKYIVSVVWTALILGLTNPASAEEIKGTGTILPAILMNSWGKAYTKHHPAVAFKYKGINTNEGVQSLLNDEIDFAVLDMPLSKEEITKNGFIQFPVALAAVTPIVNIPGVHMGQLRLSGKVIGDIFLGNITVWNDPAIVELNPKAKLPNEPIIVVHRSAPVGVKTIIGEYIAKNNPQWNTLKGSTMTDHWPATAIEAKSPKETFEIMKKTPYSIGYASLPFSIKSGLPYVHLKNPAGYFVGPSDENIIAASINAKWDAQSEFNESLSDQPGMTSWPMTNTSFVLVRKVSARPEQTKLVLNFFKSSLKTGALNAVAADYVPLPHAVRLRVMESWKGVTDTSGTPIFN